MPFSIPQTANFTPASEVERLALEFGALERVTCFLEVDLPHASGPSAPTIPPLWSWDDNPPEIIIDNTIGPAPASQFIIKTVFIDVIPTLDGVLVNQAITGDVGGTVSELQASTASARQAIFDDIQLASTFRPWAGNTSATVGIQQYGHITVFGAYPTTAEFGPYNPPLVDYTRLMREIGYKAYVDAGITMFIVMGYHGNKVTIWEDTLAYNPNISNSEQNRDLPLVDGTAYSVITLNYRQQNFLHNLCHLMEARLKYFEFPSGMADGQVSGSLFWGNFVGAVNGYGDLGANRRIGWSHRPPNSTLVYQYNSASIYQSDLLNWQPSGGLLAPTSGATWNNTDRDYFLMWLQSIPAENNGLTWNGQQLTNWWSALADFHGCVSSGWGLWAGASNPIPTGPIVPTPPDCRYINEWYTAICDIYDDILFVFSYLGVFVSVADILAYLKARVHLLALLVVAGIEPTPAGEISLGITATLWLKGVVEAMYLAWDANQNGLSNAFRTHQNQIVYDICTENYTELPDVFSQALDDMGENERAILENVVFSLFSGPVLDRLEWLRRYY